MQEIVGYTLFHYAYEVSKIEAAECLIKHGALINLKTCVIHPFYNIFMYERLNNVHWMGYMAMQCEVSGYLSLSYFIEIGMDENKKPKFSIVK